MQPPRRLDSALHQALQRIDGPLGACTSHAPRRELLFPIAKPSPTP